MWGNENRGRCKRGGLRKRLRLGDVYGKGGRPSERVVEVRG